MSVIGLTTYDLMTTQARSFTLSENLKRMILLTYQTKATEESE